MAEFFTTWWAWLALAVVLAILELFAPGFIFVGFAIGAAITGVLLALGISFGGSLAWLALFFAVVSVVAWVVCYKTFGGKGRQVQTFDEDINEG
ncbi:NfeD family protein [Vannielia litorea]|uniref:NfeD-like C-terminal, partner-binding n=1 Tax=Vannielia litorea TaxID=1217970 RepID=A0A1N6H5Q3_9RHOB|nr:hypothetical protein [Vannielia litorea]SIO15138.1 NfeD-like C-terminal, partner-binding [Vannielia litorea]